MFQLVTKSEEETYSLASQLAGVLEIGDLVLLTGDLGAGKTIFSKGVAHGLGVEQVVTSPTFAIANVYQGRVELHHLDVYRFESADEVYEAFDLGDMAASGVALIEWGELIGNHLGDDYLEIRFAYTDSPDQRLIDFEPHGNSWESRRTSVSKLLEGLK